MKKIYQMIGKRLGMILRSIGDFVFKLMISDAEIASIKRRVKDELLTMGVGHEAGAGGIEIFKKPGKGSFHMEAEEDPFGLKADIEEMKLKADHQAARREEAAIIRRGWGVSMSFGGFVIYDEYGNARITTGVPNTPYMRHLFPRQK